jgi:hypothetical protein
LCAHIRSSRSSRSSHRPMQLTARALEASWFQISLTLIFVTLAFTYSGYFYFSFSAIGRPGRGQQAASSSHRKPRATTAANLGSSVTCMSKVPEEHLNSMLEGISPTQFNVAVRSTMDKEDKNAACMRYCLACVVACACYGCWFVRSCFRTPERSVSLRTQSGHWVDGMERINSSPTIVGASNLIISHTCRLFECLLVGWCWRCWNGCFWLFQVSVTYCVASATFCFVKVACWSTVPSLSTPDWRSWEPYTWATQLVYMLCLVIW